MRQKSCFHGAYKNEKTGSKISTVYHIYKNGMEKYKVGKWDSECCEYRLH